MSGAPGRLRAAASSAPARRVLAGADMAAWPVLSLAALAVGAYFLLSGTYLSTIFEDVLIYAIAAMGLDFLGGYGGLVSLGQAGFLGLGAYGVGIAEVHGFGPWAAVGIAIGVVIGFAAVTGVVAVRVSGITYVIITLAIGQILWGLSYQWTSLTGGDNGIPVTTAPSLGPLHLSDQQTLRAATLVVFLVAFGLLMLMVRSPFGLSLRGMKSNERRLRALGYQTAIQRYLGYLVASVFAGIAGILYVFANLLVSPSTLEFSQDGYLVLMVILGGLASIWGPVLGAVVIVLFQQEVSIYLSRWQTLMGAVFIAAVIFTPDGIAGLVKAARGALHRAATAAGPGPAALAADLGASPPGPAPAPQTGPDPDLIPRRAGTDIPNERPLRGRGAP
ncbi:MAG TPA: branched-chain amino acid ABC transporter permease [Streptosporangiaceae bacterium]|nr:branched-chain amino acid ABC transporter permease [Streptosporangiaceae bacterium]